MNSACFPQPVIIPTSGCSSENAVLTCGEKEGNWGKEWKDLWKSCELWREKLPRKIRITNLGDCVTIYGELSLTPAGATPWQLT